MSARINVVNVQYTLDLYYSVKPVLTEVIIGQCVLRYQGGNPRFMQIAVHFYAKAFIFGFLWRVSNRKMGVKVTPRHRTLYVVSFKIKAPALVGSESVTWLRPNWLRGRLKSITSYIYFLVLKIVFQSLEVYWYVKNTLAIINHRYVFDCLSSPDHSLVRCMS